MGQVVMLDAAFPPAPLQWCQDIANVGGKAGAIYTFGPLTNYTPQHVVQATANGILVLPIVVPGNAPPDPRTVLDSVRQYGITGGPVAKDREAGSLYPAEWSRAFDAVAVSEGFIPIDYANLNDAMQPAETDARWLANWLRTGVMNPIPTLPPGLVAWQFVNDVQIGGSQYDVSIVADWLWSASATASLGLPHSGGKTSNMFEYNGTVHTFALAPDRTVLWARTQGGAGGQVHAQFANLGGPAAVEHEEAVTSAGTIIVRVTQADGTVQQAWLVADGAWPQPVTWFAPDQAGPFALQGVPGAKGDPGPAGAPGPDVRPQVAAAFSDAAKALGG